MSSQSRCIFFSILIKYSSREFSAYSGEGAKMSQIFPFWTKWINGCRTCLHAPDKWHNIIFLLYFSSQINEDWKLLATTLLNFFEEAVCCLLCTSQQWLTAITAWQCVYGTSNSQCVSDRSEKFFENQLSACEKCGGQWAQIMEVSNVYPTSATKMIVHMPGQTQSRGQLINVCPLVAVGP